MDLGCSKKALVFHFWRANTKFKKYFPCLDNVYIFIDGDEKVLELIRLIT